MHSLIRVSTLSLTSLTLIIASLSWADEPIEEVLVTSDFRQRSIDKIPSSVTVINQQTLSEIAVQHFEELILAVPNVNWSGDSHRARYFQIRGVGELEQYEGAPNPSVGFLIDDIDFSGIGSIATMFDLQQVEVLRGPQGSRYGANALGGLIYLKSTEPTDTYTGNVQFEVGQDDLWSAGVAVGGPLDPENTIKFRFSAHHHESDGFRDNPSLNRDDTNGRNETSIRTKINYEPNDEWFVRFTALYVDIDNDYDAFALDGGFTVLSDKPGEDTQESFGSSLRVEWDAPQSFIVTSITAVADSDIRFSFDADWGNPDSWSPFTYDFFVRNDRQRRTISQEFRFASKESGRIFNDSTDWIVGLYAIELEDDLDSNTDGLLIDPDPVLGYTFTVNDQFTGTYEATNTAIFSQLDIDTSEDSQFGVGLRVERRTSYYKNSANKEFDPSENMIGGELTYTHHLSPKNTVFVSLARGFKAGGFNPGGNIPQEREEFDTEYLWNLEAGIKSHLLSNALSVNASVFWSERRDQQIRTSFQLNPNDPASFVFFTDNAKKGRTIGFEADAQWMITEHWTAYTAIGLLEAEIREFGTPEVDLDGRDQAHAPGYTFSLGGIYRHPTGLFARLDLYARDEFFYDYSHDQMSYAYELVNVRFGQCRIWSTSDYL